jgi:hypothetical protein
LHSYSLIIGHLKRLAIFREFIELGGQCVLRIAWYRKQLIDECA